MALWPALNHTAKRERWLSYGKGNTYVNVNARSRSRVILKSDGTDDGSVYAGQPAISMSRRTVVQNKWTGRSRMNNSDTSRTKKMKDQTTLNELKHSFQLIIFTSCMRNVHFSSRKVDDGTC